MVLTHPNIHKITSKKYVWLTTWMEHGVLKWWIHTMGAWGSPATLLPPVASVPPEPRWVVRRPPPTKSPEFGDTLENNRKHMTIMTNLRPSEIIEEYIWHINHLTQNPNVFGRPSRIPGSSLHRAPPWRYLLGCQSMPQWRPEIPGDFQRESPACCSWAWLSPHPPSCALRDGHGGPGQGTGEQKTHRPGIGNDPPVMPKWE